MSSNYLPKHFWYDGMERGYIMSLGESQLWVGAGTGTASFRTFTTVLAHYPKQTTPITLYEEM
jgi:hypothetical protein